MVTAADELVLAIGSVFQGGYEILSRLGGGRFGWVYKARQLSTGQDVAIKILRFLQQDTQADIENQNARFRREMRLCAGMSHPSIVRLIDSGEANDGVLYAVFEYAQGATLREVLAAEGKLAVREALHLMSEVLDALACAHAHGVVHRDLKPDNVMVTKTGARRHALILDFGLGGFTRDAEEWALPRLTATHEILGTPCYAAPEQLRGEPPSARSDLYSWGLMFLECLTGELAVGGASGIDVIRKQLGPDPVPIPAWLRKQGLGRLLDIVTAKQVEKRDVTIPGLLEALSTIELGELPSAAPPAQPEELPEGQRRQLTVVSCRLTVAPIGRRALDPEEVDETLHEQHALYGEIAARAGGQIVGVLADRIVLVFGYPRAREDDARRAARTSLAIVAEATRAANRLATERRLRLEVRIGVHTGVVVVRDLRQATYQGLYDLVGLTPQVAVRLDEQAAANDVLVSGDTHRLMRGELEAEAAGELRTSDDIGSVAIFRLTGERKRVGLETIPWARQAPLIGRSAQLRQLLGSWEAARKGEPGVVLLSGEPGIGKSRLVRELRRNVSPDAWLEGRCVEENQASPLRPIVDLLGAREPIASMLAHQGFDVAETLPLFADFFPVPADVQDATPQFTPERHKELLLQAIVALVLRMAQERPLVLALEDLHWADPTTLELLVLLMGEVHTARAVVSDRPPRLALVFTARPEFSPPWSLEDVAVIPLARLPKDDVVELVAAGLATGRALPAALLEKVVQHSDGVPLFVEEVTRVLLDAGALADSLDERAIDDLALEIPATLRELLTARLDPLSPSARDTIQLAAVLGREFRYEVLSAVERKDESFLRDCLRELLDAGLLFARRSARSEGYVFKHALVRDTAYESMTRPRRQRLHALVAGTLRQRFPDVEQTQPELLAQHFERGGEEATAAGYWYRAGEAALKRAAYVEAQQLLERGLALLERVPESPERNRQEVALLTTLGTVFFSTKGNAAEEVEITFARARQLCEKLGEDVPIKVLNGMMTAPLARGDRVATSQLLPHFKRLAATDDPVTSIAGHAILGLYCFWSGEFQSAREHMAVGTKLYGTEEFQRWAAEYGWDGGLFCHAYEMTSLWNLGYPDQADAVRRTMVALAEQSGNPYSILLALGFAATLSYDRGETDATLETSDRVIALSTEQRLYPWLAGGHCGRGAALLDRGELPEAMGEITLGLGLYQGMGVLMSYGYYLTYLAAAHREAGNIDDGLATVEEGLSLCETLFTRFHESELLRLKGELLARRGDEGGAEASLRAAVELARRRGGKSLELRAATSLGRLLRKRGMRDEARRLVSDVYGWFTEGFDTRDLRTARALLTQVD